MSTTTAGNTPPEVQERTTCRVCSAPLRTVLDLGAQYLQGSFVKPGVSDPPKVRLPLELTRCTGEGCGLVQLRHTVPGEILYDTYWYRSRINDTMRTHLRAITESSSRVRGGRPKRVLDIGCNDGTLLDNFRDAERWGIDPSNAADDAPDDFTLIRDFFPSDELADQAGKFDIITSIAMFYDVEDPVAFAREVERLLAPGGVWTLEVAYLPTMLESTAYDCICHEHLGFYSLSSLKRVLEAAGLEVVHAELNDMYGGSICCHVARAGSAADSSVAEVLERERALGLDQDAIYDRFAEQVRTHRDEVTALLRKLREQDSTVHVYGASTKGNTLLQYCGIDRTVIPYAAERNPDKVGARTLGTDIEIISEADSRARKPDYYLVLPWHFRTEILAREAATLDAGCELIFPLPTVEVVRKRSS
ncbi:MAG: class I SAM-dependent methyltransferase [Actinophytocola sp.]|uniref:class I SAM-dependent methyltransferase n=1 Tax=Actinophytocola sp. TaxID=1872138 RepID=UPI003C754E29